MAKTTKPNKSREVMYDILQAGLNAIIGGDANVDLNGVEVLGVLGKSKDGLVLHIREDGEDKHVTFKPTIKKELVDDNDITERTDYKSQLTTYESTKVSKEKVDDSPKTQDFEKLLEDDNESKEVTSAEVTDDVDEIARQLGLS